MDNKLVRTMVAIEGELMRKKRVIKISLAMVVIATAFGLMTISFGDPSTVDFLRGITAGIFTGALICQYVAQRKARERY